MFARTARLTLRPGWPEDAPALAAAIGHEDVAMRLSRVPWPYRVADAEAFLAIPRRTTEPVFLIHAHEGGDGPRLVGGMGLHDDGGGPELGYWLTPSAWRRGYATEAGRAVVAIARDTLRLGRLRSRYHHDNPASGHVLRKLGFRGGEAVEPVLSIARGHAVDTVLMEMDLVDAGRAELSIAA